LIENTVIISTYEVGVPTARQNRTLATPMAVFTDAFQQYIERPTRVLETDASWAV
jgi:hypothetical protein